MNTLKEHTDRFRDEETLSVDKHPEEGYTLSQSENRRERGDRHSPTPTEHPSPLRLVLITIGSIFIAESVVMTLLAALPPLPNALTIFIDSSLLIVLVLLPIYLFFMKPMKHSLAELKRLEGKHRTLSLTDELTGLYNRRGLFTFAEQALRISKRRGEELCVLYGDMDNLKKINDELGHTEGDKALIKIASILKKSFRESDIIARLGGDEFAMIQVGANTESVVLATERMKRNIDEYNRSVPDEYRLSLSIGTVLSDSDTGSSIDELLAKADRLMYDQKVSKNLYH